MANMRDVNKAIKQWFPNLEIEAVRGDGYVYFVHSDKYEQLESVYANPPTTPTGEMIRLCLEQIQDIQPANSEEVNKAESLPPGTYTVEAVSPREVVVVGGAYSGRTIVGFGPSLICGVNSRRDIAFGNIPRVSPKARSYQQQAIADMIEAYLRMSGGQSTKDLIVIDAYGTYTAARKCFDDCKVAKPKKNKGPAKRKDWMGRGGDRHDARARTR